jgi:hypothetical protein
MKKKTFDLLVITTTDYEKQKMVLTAIKSIDNQNFPFINKIMSIDDFGNPLTPELLEYLDNNNWKYILHARVGMCENIEIGLKECTSDWLLYSEDDVVVNGLPLISDFDIIENKTNKKLGILSLLSSRGTGFLTDRFETFKNEISKVENYVNEDNFSAWIRNENTIDDYFIEFPITFINLNLFKKLFEYANSNLQGYQIEQGLTRAFIDGGFKNEYTKVNYLKPVDISVFEPLNYWDIMEYVTKNYLFIYNKDNYNNLSYSVNGGKVFKKIDW